MFICSLKKLNIMIDENMALINLKGIITDSLRYSASDLKIVVLLGLVLLLVDRANELSFAGEMADELRLVIFAVVIYWPFLKQDTFFEYLKKQLKVLKNFLNSII